MPRGDGTGPLGLGAMTGRGLGFCRAAQVGGSGWGRGWGRGLGLALCAYGVGKRLGRGLGCQRTAVDQNHEGEAERLSQLKADLERRIELVNARLGAIKPRD